MNIPDLEKLALQTRSMREAGMTLLIASGVLAVFILISPRALPVVAPVTIDTPTAPNAYAHLTLEAQAAIVYDLATGETLYAKNERAQLPLASLTKLLTVYTALTVLAPETPIVISSEATKVEAPRVFKSGQTFSLADLARLTLTASLNDGAVAILQSAAERQKRSGSEALASAAAALSLSQTYALNGSGLDENAAVSGGYGSASDLARLAGALVARAPEIALATTHTTTSATSVSGVSFTVKNTDPITETIPGLLLSKTGYTDLAGGNLALVFDAGLLHPIAVVVLGSTLNERFTDGATLVSATLAHFAGVASL